MGRAYEVRKASIQKTGAVKAKLYSNYAKEIYTLAKNGGTDPSGNLSLKRIIEKAKRDQVPADIIKRAIDKVHSGIDETYTSLRYEGFGPAASTIIVDCLTDNVNRTVSFVRAAFTKCKGKLGVQGSVNHMYDHLAVISFKGLSEEATLDTLLNEGIELDDIESEEDVVTVYGLPTDFSAIKEALLKNKPDIEILLDEVTMLPKDQITLEGEDLEVFQKLLAMLDEIEDVNQVYHNVLL